MGQQIALASNRFPKEVNEFEKAGISNERVYKDLNLNTKTGVSVISSKDRQNVQTLLFDFLNTSYGSGMRNALKMKYKEKMKI